MRGLLDTSVLIGGDAPGDVEASISVVSLTELHLGVLLATEPDELARRTERLAIIEHLVDVRRPQAQRPQSRQAD